MASNKRAASSTDAKGTPKKAKSDATPPPQAPAGNLNAVYLLKVAGWLDTIKKHPVFQDVADLPKNKTERPEKNLFFVKATSLNQPGVPMPSRM